MQPHSVAVKLDDQLIDAFGLGLGRWHRTQLLPVPLDPFVYVYARLAHIRRPAVSISTIDGRLWFNL